MKKILCAGESIIDFVSLENGKTLEETVNFSKQPGGSSANVAVGLAILNTPVAFTGIVGDDCFGNFLIKYLSEKKIECSLLKKTKKFNTPIVFIGLDNNGNNNFFFYRDFGLNKEYSIENKDLNFLKNTAVLHFSSVILRETNFKLQLLKLIEYVKKKNRGLIHFDANIRFGLWENHNQLKRTIIQFIKLADIIKFSENELYFVTGSENIEKSLKTSRLFKNKLVLTTAGPAGAYTYFKNKFIHIPAPEISAVDSTGAGDAFVAAFLSRLNNNNIFSINQLSDITIEQLEEWIKFANTAGSLNCLKHGATAGMLAEKNIINFIKNYEKNQINRSNS